MNEKYQWYNLTVQQVCDTLQVEENSGLSESEIIKRQSIHGPNELIDHGLKSPWSILWDQLTAIMVVILVLAAIVSALLGDYKDAIAITSIVVLNAILGFTQEYRAEKAMAALKGLGVPNIKVRRGGRVKEISVRELVPGDTILLVAGNSVPADARLLDSSNLRVKEAALTGESESIDKKPDVLRGELLLGNRQNMLYMGTEISYGRGEAVVVATGMNTELGHIAELIQTVKRDPTPLQRRLEQLGRGLAFVSIALVAVVFGLGMLRGENLHLMFLTAISLAVAAIPEGLPAVVTIALALGAQRMLGRKALIRKLPAVETLGSVDVICSDKTGTLTENRMTVTMLDVMGETQSIDALLLNGKPVLDPDLSSIQQPRLRSLGLLVKVAALCNDALLENIPEDSNYFQSLGDPTEAALVVAAAQLGLLKENLEIRLPRVDEIPFTSERKRMTTVHRVNENENHVGAPWEAKPYVVLTKGAVDGLLDITSQVWSGMHAIPLTNELRQRILAANDAMAQDGQRVIGIVLRTLDNLPEKMKEEEIEHDAIFVGLIGMIDPPRSEVKVAVQICKTAGIRPVMITGDHPLTAQSIALELGISNENRTITGSELEDMSVAELEDIVEATAVYARVSPN